MNDAWPDQHLSELADYINGRAFKPTDFTTTGLPVVRIRELLDPETVPDLFDGAVDSRHLIRDGDLIFWLIRVLRG
jgi:type I restriction enzyme S subunit